MKPALCKKTVYEDIITHKFILNRKKRHLGVKTSTVRLECT